MLILKLHHIPYLTHCTVLHYIVLHIHKMNQLYLSDSWVGDKKKKIPSTKDDSNKNSHFIE